MSNSSHLPRTVRFSDVRGVVQLATQATLEVSRVVEGVHQSVLSTIGFSPSVGGGRAAGVTGFVYQSIRNVAQWLGTGSETVLAGLQRRFDADGEDGLPGSPKREAILAALNGIIGDRLAAMDSPFATTMSVRYLGAPVSYDALRASPISGKIVLVVHGLCMNDRQWQAETGGRQAEHGEVLAAELGYTPLYLRYNSGRHVSQNGRELAQQLEHLISIWPCPIEEISVVAHSMGGLLIRSAAQYASQSGLRWRSLLRKIVFLGTPHHGAPLERGGNIIDALLGVTPFTAPFARLGRLRSAGITDLRYGNVLDEDWAGQDRFHRKADSRRIVPLPENVACFAVAATTAARRGVLADRLIGDGLVPLRSALGEHGDARRSLHFSRSAQWIAYRTGHNALLTSAQVSRKLVQWFGTPEAL